MILGDLGADVIKVEQPGKGDQSRGWGPPFLEGESAYYLGVNRNKRSITLNIASKEGQELLAELIEGADVFLTNLRSPEALERYHIDYETFKQRNPALIYVAISGYGHTGPRAGQSGYDIIAQGESGIMALTGEPDGGPVRFPTPVADMTAGLFTTIGILAALHGRQRTGEGRFIDISLLESQMTWLANYAGEYFVTGQEPPRRGNSHPQVVPYEPMQGSDGEWFILGVGSDNVWRKFCHLVGWDDLRDDPRFATNSERVRNRDELLPLVRELMRQRPAAAWVEAFRAAKIPAGPIRNVGQALSDPQISARGFLVELEHPAIGAIRSLAMPLQMTEQGLSYRRYPPRLGEHTVEVLGELGYGAERVEGWKERNVV
jgi:crotonobetainyl-CoA:carnitine CoA-transferase CaiB-like acyl-CoA transferase